MNFASSGMTYARFFPSDWRTGCLTLNLEEEGLYVRVCMYMYDTGTALIDNDVRASQLLRVQIQKYQKVMGSLIAKGKIIRAQGVLINERVIEEFDRWKLSQAARSEAAKKREAQRKEQLQRDIAEAVAKGKAEEEAKAATPQATPLPTPQATPRGTPRRTPGGDLGVPHDIPQGVTAKKPNEMNGHGTTAVPEQWHNSGSNPESIVHSPEAIDNKLASNTTPSAGGLAGLNGSAEPMIADIVKWMTNGDIASAKQWLSTFLGQYPQEVVRASYMKLKTDVLDGKIISHPLRTWASIADRIKNNPPKPPPNGRGRSAEAEKSKLDGMFAKHTNKEGRV